MASMWREAFEVVSFPLQIAAGGLRAAVAKLDGKDPTEAFSKTACAVRDVFGDAGESHGGKIVTGAMIALGWIERKRIRQKVDSLQADVNRLMKRHHPDETSSS